MTGHRRGARYEAYPEVRAAVGENPARYLDRELSTNAAANEMFWARVRGLRDPKTIEAWLHVEVTLDRPEAPREQVVELLERRLEKMELASRTWLSEDPGPDEPIHTGGDPADPPSKTPAVRATGNLAKGAARHYHYITKAKPFLEARGDRDDRTEAEPASGSDGEGVAVDAAGGGGAAADG